LQVLNQQTVKICLNKLLCPTAFQAIHFKYTVVPMLKWAAFMNQHSYNLVIKILKLVYTLDI